MADARKAAIAQFLLGQSGLSLPELAGSAPATAAPARTAVRRKGGKTAYVGDSLGVGTAPYLRKKLGKVQADVVSGRSSEAGVKALRGMRGYDRVVLDLGTNDGDAHAFAKSLKRADKLTGNAPIYVSKVHGPDAKAKNRALKRLAGGDIHVVRPGKRQIGPDGIHFSGQGYKHRAARLARQIR
jgi:hypothetical protein